MSMKLDEMVKNTDALTYLNALRVTQSEIKEVFAEVEDQVGYVLNACDRIRKLTRKADNQYRLLVKTVQKDAPLTSNISVADIEELNSDDIEELMSSA